MALSADELSADELEFDVGCLSVDPFVKERRRVSRPSEGKRTESFMCRTCGREVAVRVSSRKAARLGCVWALLRAVAMLGFTAWVYSSVETGEVSLWEGVLLCAAFVTLLGGLAGLAVVLFTNNWSWALNFEDQHMLEQMNFGGHVHKFSEPGKDVWH
jgi:Ni/Fe-hydrogenase subunit HybB-like protein